VATQGLFFDTLMCFDGQFFTHAARFKFELINLIIIGKR